MVTSKFSILPNSKPTILPTYKSYLCQPKYLYLVSRQATETSVVQTTYRPYFEIPSCCRRSPPSIISRVIAVPTTNSTIKAVTLQIAFRNHEGKLMLLNERVEWGSSYYGGWFCPCTTVEVGDDFL